MGVHGEPRKSESDATHHVRSLATNTGNGHKVFHGGRTPPTEAFEDGPSHTDEAAGLGPKEARRMDELFHPLLRSLGKALGIRELGEQVRRDDVHPYVRALG